MFFSGMRKTKYTDFEPNSLMFRELGFFKPLKNRIFLKK